MATVTPPKKKCKRLVHNGTERVECGELYSGSDCPNRAIHVMKFKSGFCAQGKCEGTKPKNFDGTPARCCKLFATCGCDCHARLDDMFKLAGMDRLFIENPEWTPDFIHFDPDDYATSPSNDAHFSPLTDDVPSDVEGHVPTPARPPQGTLARTRTDTGRAARGGLESQVWEQCRRLIDAGFTDGQLITPKILADMIREQYKIPTPSTGAIGAVFDRWTKLDFAKCAKKPVRFIGFTGEGTWIELERIKSKAKREKRMTQSAARRGYRN